MNGSVKTYGVNKLLLLSTLVLMCLGCVVVYTASTTHALKLGLTPEYYLKAHCWKVVVALAAMFVAAKVDYSIWKKGARVIFAVGCILTLAAIVAGGDVKGASRWIWGIQPSEILKLGLITMVATKLSEAGMYIKTLKCSVIQPGVPFVISAILLALQPNFSMLILFAGITIVLLLVAGARLKYLLPVMGGGALVGVIALLIKSHTSKRIAAFLDPTANQNSAMQGERALEALGNGGIFGTGIGMGMQKLGYLPEAHKDVVYAVIGEEMGFIGTFLIRNVPYLGAFRLHFLPGIRSGAKFFYPLWKVHGGGPDDFAVPELPGSRLRLYRPFPDDGTAVAFLEFWRNEPDILGVVHRNLVEHFQVGNGQEDCRTLHERVRKLCRPGVQWL